MALQNQTFEAQPEHGSPVAIEAPEMGKRYLRTKPQTILLLGQVEY